LLYTIFYLTDEVPFGKIRANSNNGGNDDNNNNNNNNYVEKGYLIRNAIILVLSVQLGICRIIGGKPFTVHSSVFNRVLSYCIGRLPFQDTATLHLILKGLDEWGETLIFNSEFI
jgi:hypothetical protein